MVTGSSMASREHRNETSATVPQKAADPPESQPGFGFPRDCRLTSGQEYQHVFGQRQAASDSVMTVFAARNGLSFSRLGLSVSRRKVGNSVSRHRWKRMLREAFRLTRHELPVGFDWVIVPRRAEQPTLAEAQSSLKKLTARLARRLERPSS